MVAGKKKVAKKRQSKTDIKTSRSKSKSVPKKKKPRTTMKAKRAEILASEIVILDEVLLILWKITQGWDERTFVYRSSYEKSTIKFIERTMYELNREISSSHARDASSILRMVVEMLLQAEIEAARAEKQKLPFKANRIMYSDGYKRTHMMTCTRLMDILVEIRFELTKLGPGTSGYILDARKNRGNQIVMQRREVALSWSDIAQAPEGELQKIQKTRNIKLITMYMVLLEKSSAGEYATAKEIRTLGLERDGIRFGDVEIRGILRNKLLKLGVVLENKRLRGYYLPEVFNYAVKRKVLNR